MLYIDGKRVVPVWAHQQDFEDRRKDVKLDGEKWEIYTETLKALKKDPNVKIISREAGFRSSFHKETSKTSKYLKGPPLNGKIEKDKLFRKEAEKPIKK